MQDRGHSHFLSLRIGYRPRQSQPYCKDIQLTFEASGSTELRSTSEAGLCSITTVILQQADETFPASDFPNDTSGFLIRFNQLVVDSLVVPFSMLVSNVLLQDSFERVLAEELHLFRALRTEASYEILEIRIHTPTPRKKKHGFDFGPRVLAYLLLIAIRPAGQETDEHMPWLHQETRGNGHEVNKASHHISSKASKADLQSNRPYRCAYVDNSPCLCNTAHFQ